MPLAASDTHTCLLAIQLAWGPGDDGTVAHACARARVHACNAWVANTVPWQPLQTRGSLSCRKEHMRLYAMQRCQVNTRERERERRCRGVTDNHGLCELRDENGEILLVYGRPRATRRQGQPASCVQP